ncbi:MAG: hypothetical protein HFF80_04200 [Oscillospiraceae bacterium]|jgi:hypothetical protein|nr:hypothetical protein [Oscillospiraceae bacterium]
MTEKQDHNKQNDPLMDTQRLLLGVDPDALEHFSLEDILAEYSGAAPEPAPPPQPEPAPPPEPEPSPPPEEPAPHRRRGRPRREPPPQPPEPPADAPAPEPEEPAENAFDDPPFPEEPAPPPPVQEAPPENQPPEPPGPISMEAVVASTVDAVKEEQEQHQEKLRRQLEKLRRRKEPRPVKRREPSVQHPLPEPKDEPPPAEAANWHKRRLRECRRSLLLGTPVVIVLWLPWVLAHFGIETPFFSESSDNAALCVLVAQALTSILCWPVYRAAVDGFRDRAWTVYATALLTTAVTLFDEMTFLLLPGRCDEAPLGGIASVLTLFALWGLTGYHRGMSETFRTAAVGMPSRVADCCEQGVAKGAGDLRGFYTRTSMEDTASQWQRLLLPVLAASSAVFAVLSSLGQERGQDLLWCWSVVLCASSSLVFPLAFCVPFGRLAYRLTRSGAAVAGHYGAAALSASRRLVAADGDLFPPGSASLGGLKLYGEERNRALSYAATLAVQGGGLLGRVFADACQSSRVSYQSLEHFHIHDDSGLSGMIHGETVLVGTPAFMRHKAVRLPASLPSKTAVCLAVDGTLTAVFSIKYTPASTADAALRAMRRNGLQLILAVRDGNITPKLLKSKFGTDCGAERPELGERLALSDPEREAGAPNGLLYREGLLPFVSLAVGSRRLCQTVLVGNLISIFSSIAGALLGFYLTFTGSYAVLTPPLLLTYLLLWVAPMLPLVWTVDKL